MAAGRGRGGGATQRASSWRPLLRTRRRGVSPVPSRPLALGGGEPALGGSAPAANQLVQQTLDSLYGLTEGVPTMDPTAAEDLAYAMRELANSMSSAAYTPLGLAALATLLAAGGFITGTLFTQRGELERRERTAAGRQRYLLSEVEPEALKELMASSDLPSWLAFRDVDNAAWLNRMVDKAWPYLDRATSGVIVAALDPILQATRPSFLTTLRFERFSFGKVPARIEGVKVHDTGDEASVEVDLDVFWAGDPDVVLAVRAAQDTVSVPISLTEVQGSVTVRLIFHPLLPTFPCFGAISIALMNKPKLDFDLRVVGGDITLVPGLAAPLRTYFKGLIASYLVWPRRITVPIPGTGFEVADSGGRGMRTGTLRVRVLACADLLGENRGHLELGLQVRWPFEYQGLEVRGLAKAPWDTAAALPVHDPLTEDLWVGLFGESEAYEEDLDDEEREEMELRGEVEIPLSQVVGIVPGDVGWGEAWGPIQVSAELGPLKGEEIAAVARERRGLRSWVGGVGRGIASGTVAGASKVADAATLSWQVGKAVVLGGRDAVSEEGVGGLRTLAARTASERGKRRRSAAPAAAEEGPRRYRGKLRLEVSYEPVRDATATVIQEAAAALGSRLAAGARGGVDSELSVAGSVDELEELDELISGGKFELVPMDSLDEEALVVYDEDEDVEELELEAGAVHERSQTSVTSSAPAEAGSQLMRLAHAEEAEGAGEEHAPRSPEEERLRKLQGAAVAALLAMDEAESLPVAQRQRLEAVIAKAGSLITTASQIAQVAAARGDDVPGDGGSESKDQSRTK